MIRVRDACEKIQHCKEELPADKEKAEKDKAIDGIGETISQVKSDYKEVALILKRFYGESVEEEKKDEAPESPKAEKSK